MELKDILSKRRSIRSFAPKAVERGTIDELLSATLTAPSSRNSHSTHFVVVSDSSKIERLASMRDYGSAFISSAPLFILVCGDTQATDLWDVNCAISATVMQLAATDLGLVSCWVHIDNRPQLKDNPQGAKAIDVVREVVELPQGFEVLCGIAVGYSDFEPKALPNFDGQGHIRFVE